MKKTNKFLLAALVCGSFATSAVAQGLYAGAHAGYLFSTAPEVVGTASTQNNADQTQSNIYSTRGGGISAGVNIGYMISEHFGLDLGVDYFSASAQKTTTSDATSTTGGFTQTSAGSFTAGGTQIRLTPSLVVSGGKEGFQPFARFGVVIPVSGSTTSDISSVTTLGSPINKTYTTTAKAEVSGVMTIGFSSAIGANFALSDKLSLFGELALTTLSIKAASAKYTAYNSEGALGTKTLADLKTCQKETIYVDKLTNTSNNSDFNADYNQDKADEQLAPTANYNALGINVGVKFAF